MGYSPDDAWSYSRCCQQRQSNGPGRFSVRLTLRCRERVHLDRDMGDSDHFEQAVPIHGGLASGLGNHGDDDGMVARPKLPRSEEHTSELQSLMRISYAVFCLKKKKQNQ